MSDEKRKRGRPVTRHAKNNVIAVRADDKTRDALCDVSEYYGVSKSELLKKWVQNQHKMMENGIDLL